jgi:DNA primase
MLDLRLVIDDSPVGEAPIKVRCPAHKERSASLAVYPDHVHCFGCGFHSVGVDALALLLKTDNETAAAQWSKYTSEAIDSYRERATEHAKSSPLPIKHAELFCNQLFGRFHQRLEWLTARGLTLETIGDNLIGHNGEQFTIPIFDDNGNLISFRYRADPLYCRPEFVRQHKYVGMAGRNGRYLYPAPDVMADMRDWSVLCEGEFDTLLARQDGLPAATLTNGAGQMKRLPAMLPSHIKTAYVAADIDEAGLIARDETITAALDLGLTTYTVEFSDTAKDYTDARQQGWRFNRGDV